ncbi:hypothetical protein LWC08_03985 [Desulfobaculum bizertense]|uniref:contractile injection system protein, VgrG/Pvc8 family n=1 Tax=Desulfobaculum bizertense TaxID=376490 RepID=UPI001F3EB7B0|nr:contractile injection system protein, VgrG/Pvc8 family [Desulfobaculum bizertense]UIJ38739.1 hypothetical protein LWC08_03985 [Desulfobaculum bizertense]
MGLEKYAPAFRIVADGDDITTVIRERLISLSLTDEAGMQADSLTVELDDSAPQIRLPRTGAELRVWLGYGEQVEFMGLYVMDGVTLSGPPEKMVLKASGAPFEQSRAYSQLQDQKTRSWVSGELRELVEAVAAKHGLEPAIGKDLKSLALPHLDQIAESDMNLLTRVADSVGAVAKANGGSLVFVKRGEGKTASGRALPEIKVTPQDVTSWRVSITERVNFRKVSAGWRDVETARDVLESAGEGSPEFRIRHSFPNKEAARKAAEAKLDAFQRGKRTLSVTLPGDPKLRAEAKLNLMGFRLGVSGTWSLSKVTHSLTRQGYVVTGEGRF